jgi:hypothetical protein
VRIWELNWRAGFGIDVLLQPAQCETVQQWPEQMPFMVFSGAE